jgi:cyclohexyl-isocyanide hydratase
VKRGICVLSAIATLASIFAMSNPEPLTILFPLYPGVTQLDFTGPYQFFVRLPGVKTIVASVEGKSVDLEGLTFSGLAPLERIERCDVLCVPGGRGCTDAIRDPRYLSAIRSLADTARYITSVCTGSLILGAAGLLEGKRAACHWAWR